MVKKWLREANKHAEAGESVSGGLSQCAVVQHPPRRSLQTLVSPTWENNETKTSSLLNPIIFPLLSPPSSAFFFFGFWVQTNIISLIICCFFLALDLPPHLSCFHLCFCLLHVLKHCFTKKIVIKLSEYKLISSKSIERKEFIGFIVKNIRKLNRWRIRIFLDYLENHIRFYYNPVALNVGLLYIRQFHNMLISETLPIFFFLIWSVTWVASHI